MNYSKFSITVFTPTYNRASTLGRVYESLKTQTFRNFEWLIVDDGSIDGTKELVEQWVSNSALDFPIRYAWQENAHKKAAHNRAINEAAGELLVVFDSDDWCVPQALERFWHYWNTIPDNQREYFVGVCSLCMDESGSLIGDRFPGGNYFDSDFLDIRYRMRVSGEKWGAMRTDVLKAFPFREDIRGLVPEGTVWYAIARYYKTRFFNEALRIYSQDVPGLITRRDQIPDHTSNALGAAYAKKFYLENNIMYMRHAPMEFIFEAARLTRFWLHTPWYLRKKNGYWPKVITGKLLVAVCIPLGIGMWLVDCGRRICRRLRQGKT